jgi:hypothetical protein
MKKLLALGLMALSCLFTISFNSSCDDKKEDNNSLLVMSLIRQPSVYLFQAALMHTADFDLNNDGNPRPELDALALAEYAASHSDLGCSNVHAFITVNGSDTIAGLGIPSDLPVKSPNGTIIANDLADLLDGSILVSLQGAGVTTGFYWTGASSSGGLTASSNTCSGWTSENDTEPPTGRNGSASSTSGSWLDNDNNTCLSQINLIGVCW